jgi:hypothetical protein
MTLLLILLLVVPVPAPQQGDITLEAFSLKRGDLPNDFPFQVLDVGFAVIKLTIANETSAPFALDPDDITVMNPKKKKIKRALPTDITPKLMKYHRGGQRGIHGEAYSGPPLPPGAPVPTISPGREAGSVSINVAQNLRATLEQYQIKAIAVPSGGTVEGFFYLKSKKSGAKLSNSTVKLGSQVAAVR